jgi:hypothetical protein
LRQAWAVEKAGLFTRRRQQSIQHVKKGHSRATNCKEIWLQPSTGGTAADEYRKTLMAKEYGRALLPGN